jgi:thiol:disulfide interchange protein DsbD
MMKHIYLTFTLLLTGLILYAQSGSAKQVKWEYSSRKVGSNTYEVHMTATVAGKFHIYGQNVGVEGPVPTNFQFTANPLLTIDGKPRESGSLIKKFESAWSGTVNYYEQKVDFVQLVKLKANAKTNVSGRVAFMVCNDSMCLPPSEVEFKIPVGG